MLDQCATGLIGENPFAIERIWHTMYKAWFYPPGREKIHALGALDLALWDIKGKATNLSLAKLVGGHRDRVVTYASGALMRGYTNDHCVKAAPKLIEKGFRQMKMQLALPGNTNPLREVA